VIEAHYHPVEAVVAYQYIGPPSEHLERDFLFPRSNGKGCQLLSMMRLEQISGTSPQAKPRLSPERGIALDPIRKVVPPTHPLPSKHFPHPW
jgi:hypothetical protein